MLRITLASLALLASVVSAKHAFQTFPQANAVVQTNRNLTINWIVKEEFSNESPNVDAPPLLSAVLGTNDDKGVPILYYPPLNGYDNDIPLSAGTWQWEWDFTIFKTQKLAPRGTNGNLFFVQLVDGNGYISSGQKFRINELQGTTTPSTAPTDPAIPSTDPTTPNTEPAIPSTDPTTPNTEPTTPSTDSATPSTSPTNPDASPKINPSTSPKTGTDANANPTNPKTNSDNAASSSDAVTEDSTAVMLSPKLAVAAATVLAYVGGFLM